ncbi:ISL3 family transposase [Kitasatospora sp. NPDC057542]|uniref:ISL3 family transposase n=1 Tax=Kitasatospora sp. NPDC057542 TaxID=3346162 RepID=UPI00367AB736
MEARSTTDGARCPGCGTWSSRVHGSYLRFPADLPSAGRRVVLALRVRRLACFARSCPRRTFVEQVDGLTRRHGQSTERLRSAVAAVGLALAGRAGERMVRLLGLRGSRSTLLRRVMELPDLPVGAPTAIGVDDFALRKGHVYGTMIIDATTHRVLDLLPDRDASTLGPWLADQPQVEVICRDRASAYAEAASSDAPQAQQIADRYHLWHNLTQAVERTVLDHRSCLNSLPMIEPEPEPQWETPLPADDSADVEEEIEQPADPTGRMAERRIVHHALVHELLERGMSMREVARHLGWSRYTIRRYAHAARWQDMMKDRRPRASKLDPFKPYLVRRWEETGGKITGRVLFEEITARGYRGGLTLLAQWKRQALIAPDSAPPPPPPPSIRQVTGWLTRHPAGLTLDEEVQRKAILAHCPELDTAAGLVTSFAEMLTRLEGEHLTEWITAAMTSGLAGISTFAAGLNNDYDAVHAGLTTHWNSGPVEGTVNRIILWNQLCQAAVVIRWLSWSAVWPLLGQRPLQPGVGQIHLGSR